MSHISEANRAWKDEAAKRREKQEQSRNLPSRFQGGRIRPRWVSIVGGNELEDGSDGILYEASVTSVPSAYDPDVTDTFIDGVGRGILSIDGVTQDGYVLVVNSDAGTFRNALTNSDVAWVGDPIAMPVDGGGVVLVYTVM